MSFTVLINKCSCLRIQPAGPHSSQYAQYAQYAICHGASVVLAWAQLSADSHYHFWEGI